MDISPFNKGGLKEIYHVGANTKILPDPPFDKEGELTHPLFSHTSRSGATTIDQKGSDQQI